MNDIILILCLITLGHSWDPLVATNPTLATQNLHKLLTSMQGKYIVSGQFVYFEELKNLVGKTPALQGFDMQNYSPHNPWHDDWSSWDDGTVAKAIDWYHTTESKGIVSFQWHWFSPMNGNLKTSTFYTQYTTFDTSKAVIVGTQEYEATLRDIDAIAVQLKRLKDMGVPVLWRPLHEAGGKWFWWGSHGASVTLKLYDIMFNRLDQHHKLNNLIWVWSTPEADWYPGKEKVDIIGYDSYPGPFNYDCRLNMFMQLHDIVNGSKLVALTENGPLPNIANCWAQGAHWSYFMGWSDLIQKQNTRDHLYEQFHSTYTKNLDNI